jgi:hypothetical protein
LDEQASQIFSVLGQDDLLQFLGADDDADEDVLPKAQQQNFLSLSAPAGTMFRLFASGANPAQHAIFRHFRREN